MKPKTPSIAERSLRWGVRRLAQLTMLVRDEIERAELDSNGLYKCTCGYVHVKGSKPCVDFNRSGSPRNIS